MADLDSVQLARHRHHMISGEHLLLAGLSFYVAVVVLWPMARLLLEAFRPAEDGAIFGTLLANWQSRSFARALTNTLTAGIASTLVSVALGAPMAFALKLTDIPGRGALMFVMLLPMLIPPQISALAWIELSGPSSQILGVLGLAPPPGTTNPLYSLGGIIWVMGLEHAPLVLLVVAAGLSTVPRDLIEAGRLAGARPLQVCRSIILPILTPSVFAGAALAFVSTIGNFGVPALLGIPGRVTLLTTLIYQRLNGFGPSVLGDVAAIGVALVGLAGLGIALRALFERKARAGLDRTTAAVRAFSLGRARTGITLAVWSFAVIVAILPLLALLTSALVPALGVRFSLDTASLANFQAVLANPAVLRAFGNSFVLAAMTAIACAAIAVPLAHLSVVRNWRMARVLDLAAEAPFAVPGTVVALGMIIVFLPPLPLLGVSIYGSFAIILVAYLSRFLVLALRPVSATLQNLDPAIEEAGRVFGAAPIRRLVALIAPLALPSALTGGLLIFMSAFNELTLSALLWSSGMETLGVMVFFLQYEGNSPAAAALATMVVATTLTLAAAIDVLGRRFAPGVVPWQS